MASLITSILSITQTITGQSPRFTPPTECSSKFTFEGPQFNALASGILVRNALDNMPDTTCYPPYFAAFRRAPSSVQVYSPAACPSGYKTPVHIDNAGVTTEVCCESGFSYSSYYSSANFGNFSRLYLGCISTLTGTTVVPNRATESVDSSVTVTGPLTMWAQPISVAYQEKDLSLFASFSSGSSTAQQTATTTGSSSSSTSQAPDSGLSTGAKAGIGISIAAVVILLVAGAIFLVMRHRRRRLVPYNSVPAPYVPSSYYAKEMPNNPKVEMPMSNAVYEKSTDTSERESFYRSHDGRRVRPIELE